MHDTKDIAKRKFISEEPSHCFLLLFFNGEMNIGLHMCPYYKNAFVDKSTPCPIVPSCCPSERLSKLLSHCFDAKDVLSL